MFLKLKKRMEKINEIDEKKVFEPINKEHIENIIKLTEVANKVDCKFTLCVKLGVDEFVVTSDSFKGIKMINNKKEGAKLLIQYSNMLFSTDTYIDVDTITDICIKCIYSSEESEDNV